MKKTPQQQIANPHDKFIRTVMSDLHVARDFFKQHLPADMLKVINLDKLKLQPRSHINDMRKETTVDLLYKTTIDEEEIYLYLLLEHQSTPDETMAFRILKYICNIIDHHQMTNKTKSIPLIYPMLIYHAETPYPFSTDIKDMVKAPMELVDKYFLKPFHLVDLGQIKDEQLKKHAWAGVMEFALKHIFARDIMPFLRDFADLMYSISQSDADGENYVAIVLQYILERADLGDKEAFYEIINTKISPEVGEQIMSLGDRLRAEGRAEGIAKGIAKGEIKGKLEIAERLLAEKLEISFIKKVTGLTTAQINALKRKH